MSSLVRSVPPEEHGLHGLRARLKELESVLEERDAEIARLTADLDAFKMRYRQEVGLLHEELDELERAISEAELGELAKRVERDGQRSNAPPSGPRPEPTSADPTA